ncbi:hypothetical protein F4774DRAFT_203910 [Daldinia eschscholtzii]|nr:hypothetical protein F4774DRAFT_203910 [Daldinia eschscholtzii]
MLSRTTRHLAPLRTFAARQSPSSSHYPTLLQRPWARFSSSSPAGQDPRSPNVSDVPLTQPYYIYIYTYYPETYTKTEKLTSLHRRNSTKLSAGPWPRYSSSPSSPTRSRTTSGSVWSRTRSGPRCEARKTPLYLPIFPLTFKSIPPRELTLVKKSQRPSPSSKPGSSSSRRPGTISKTTYHWLLA